MLNGLKNLGNTCYLNVIIQSLSNLDLFINYLKSNINIELSENCKEYNFTKNLKNLLIAMNHVDRKVISPHQLFIEFNKNIDSNENNIIGFSNQEDSEEILLQILNLVHESIKYNVTISYKGIAKNIRDKLMIESLKHWNSYCSKNGYSEIIKLFYGQFLSQTLCDNCKYSNNNFEPFLPINIQINHQCNTLKEAFNLFTNVENIEDYKCDKCNNKNTTKKQLVIWKSPHILIIVLKRFLGYEKFQQNIQFPLEMNLKDYVKGYDNDNSNYILNSVIEHQGETNFGHYVCYCKKNDEFYKFNDEHISKVNNLDNVQAYILMYNKI